jgi:hypothetical protein
MAVQKFSIDRVTKSGAIFDQTKLQWVSSDNSMTCLKPKLVTDVHFVSLLLSVEYVLNLTSYTACKFCVE